MISGKYKIIGNWLLVIAWIGVIFWFSSQPNLKSEMEPLFDLIFRKIAHLVEYFVLTYLLYLAFKNQGSNFKPSLFFSLAAAILVASADEYYQSFIAGRSGNIRDVLVDIVGVFISTALIKLNHGKRRQSAGLDISEKKS